MALPVLTSLPSQASGSNSPWNAQDCGRRRRRELGELYLALQLLPEGRLATMLTSVLGQAGVSRE